MNIPNKRNLNIEALRCLLMFFIILCHLCNRGVFSVSGEHQGVKAMVWALSWPTNAFIFISGWYGVRFTARKLINFLVMGIYTAFVIWLVSPAVSDHRTFSLDFGWFGCAYILLMLFAPVLNAGLNKLKDDQVLYRKAISVLTLGLILSWLPLKALNITVAVVGWGGGGALIMFYLYVLARYLNSSKRFCAITKRQASLLFIFSMCGHVLLLSFGQAMPCLSAVVGSMCLYNSPFVVMAAISVFVIFKELRLPHWILKICAFLAPSMFTVYLLHEAVSPSICLAIRNLFVENIYNVTSSFIPFADVVAVVVGALAIFAMACFVDMGRRVLLAIGSRIFENRFKNLES